MKLSDLGGARAPWEVTAVRRGPPGPPCASLCPTQSALRPLSPPLGPPLPRVPQRRLLAGPGPCPPPRDPRARPAHRRSRGPARLAEQGAPCRARPPGGAGVGDAAWRVDRARASRGQQQQGDRAGVVVRRAEVTPSPERAVCRGGAHAAGVGNRQPGGAGLAAGWGPATRPDLLPRTRATGQQRPPPQTRTARHGVKELLPCG